MSDLTIILLLIWSLPWKGVALWRAAHRHDKWWFVVLLVIQTAGLLEILYIFWLSKRKSPSDWACVWRIVEVPLITELEKIGWSVFLDLRKGELMPFASKS